MSTTLDPDGGEAKLIGLDRRLVRDVNNAIGVSFERDPLEDLGITMENVGEYEAVQRIYDDGTIVIELPVDEIQDDE